MNTLRATLPVCLLSVAAAGCGGESAPGAPLHEGAARSAVLVTLDTTRADALGAYGGLPGLTPALDALAAEGVVYEQARTVAPITLPSHASMLTGLYPPRHSARDNSLNPVPASALTLAERASDAGIETAAFVASVVLDAAFGLDQGFATYSTPTASRGRPRARIGLYDERSGSEVVAEAVEWLDGLERDRRFFLWVHLFDAHSPYVPPEAALARAGGDAYLGEVAAADDAVGRLISALRAAGRLDDTFVMVVGDHGEGLGEHGETTHGVFCYETTLRVPFLVRYPDGFHAGTRSAEVVSVVDVHPTLAEALDLGESAAADGVSLYRRGVPRERGVYFESFYGTIHYGWAPVVGWVDAAGKYMYGQRAEFFDLAADPHEEVPLEVTGAERTAYRKAVTAVLDRAALAPEGQVEPVLLERLQALGYVTSGSRTGLRLPDPFSAHDLPDPRDRHEEAERVREAIVAIHEDRVTDAISILEGLVADNPRNAAAVEFLAPALIEVGRCDDAIPLLEGLIDSGVARALTHVNLGRCLETEGRTAEAQVQFRRAATLEPENPAVRQMLERGER